MTKRHHRKRSAPIGPIQPKEIPPVTDAADPSRSAADHVGAHLLGWKPRPPDDRDYALEDYVAAHQRTAEALTADMTLQQVHDSFPLTAWSEIYAFWRAFKALFAAPPAPTPTPTPTPTPADQPVVWTPGPISDQGQTPHCHPAGTLVRMANGSHRPIEQIRPFDTITTAEGHTDTVTALIGHHHDGEMIHVQLRGHRVGINCTPEHPVRTRDGYVQAGALAPGMEVACPNRRHLAAADATLEVACVVPRSEWTTERRTYANRHGSAVMAAISAPPATITLDYDFGFLLGLYAAEGYGRGGVVHFAFGKHEAETLVPRCSDLIRSVLGAEPRIQQRPNNVVIVNVDGTHWRKFFHALVGAGVAEKRITLDGPREYLRGVLEGWLAGDGHDRRTTRQGVTISRTLAFDMHGIASDLGLRPVIRRTIGKASGSVRSRRDRYDVEIAAGDGHNAAPQATGVTWRKIAAITRSAFAGRVYNLEVDGDHSFVANGIGSHNCVGYTGLDWGNTLPIDDQWPNSEGNTIYYACKVVDGEPRAEDGSTTRSLFKVLKQMGRCDAYAFTSSVDTIRSYVRGHGPVAIGIPWDNDMFHPDSDGYVHVGGGVAGGHEILIHAHYPAGTMTEDGFVAKEASFRLANHWGTGWARNGFFYMTEATLADRMSQGGDAGAGLELA